MAVVWTEAMLAELATDDPGHVVAARLGLSLGSVTGKRFRIKTAKRAMASSVEAPPQRERVAPGAKPPKATPEERRERKNALRRRLRDQRRAELGLRPIRRAAPVAAAPVDAASSPVRPAGKPVAQPADALYRLVGRPLEPRRVARHVRTCQWPLDNPDRAAGGGRFVCCGEAVELGRPYCPSHCDLAYARRAVVGAPA